MSTVHISQDQFWFFLEKIKTLFGLRNDQCHNTITNTIYNICVNVGKAIVDRPL